jgi:hypothetical protein
MRGRQRFLNIYTANYLNFCFFARRKDLSSDVAQALESGTGGRATRAGSCRPRCHKRLRVACSSGSLSHAGGVTP